jgi:pSer/pThr/pTyr-binding forkhead associated (FHA) protein
VKIKWADDKVAAQHAIMTYDGNVYIEPYKGEEILVNSRLVGGKTKLNHNDLIQLGPKSVTILRFLAKEIAGGKAPVQQSASAPPSSRRIVIKSKNT